MFFCAPAPYSVERFGFVMSIFWANSWTTFLLLHREDAVVGSGFGNGFFLGLGQLQGRDRLKGRDGGRLGSDRFRGLLCRLGGGFKFHFGDRVHTESLLFGLGMILRFYFIPKRCASQELGS